MIEYSKRIFGLDILRFIAITTVLYNHSGDLYCAKFMDQNKYNYFRFDGVTVFFVLSGFLIGNILIKTIQKNGVSISSLKMFLFRRWFRTLPLYYLILFFLLIVSIIYDRGISHVIHFYRYLFFLQNFYKNVNNFFLVSWSLAVEEWFYLLIPAVIWLSIYWFKISLKKLLPILITTILLLCFALRAYKFLLPIQTPLDKYTFTVLCRLDSLMYGVLGAYLSSFFIERWDRLKKTGLVLGIVIIIVDYVFFNYQNLFPWLTNDTRLFAYRQIFHFSIMPFSIMLTLPYFNGLRKGSGLLYRFIIFTSIISYSLYLVHLGIVATLNLPERITTLLPANHFIQVYSPYVLFWLLSFIISYFMYTYYELPTTALRNKFSHE